MSRKENVVLAELVRQQQIQPESAEWLKCVTDPFHDTDFDPTGFPDIECGATIAQLIKQSVTVSATSFGGLGGANWDLQVVLMPFMGKSSNTSIGGLSNGRILTYLALPDATVKLANLMLIAVPAGGRMVPGTAIPVDPGWRCLSLGTIAYTKGWARMVGQAFEVANTTAEISKQGSVTVYKKPASITRDGFRHAAALLTLQNRVAAAWPATIAEAELLSGSRTWDAKEGAYVVQAMNNLDNPLISPTAVPVFLPDEDPAGIPVTNVGIATDITAAGVMTNGLDFGTLSDIPFDMGGAYFQGLSQATTLKITLRSIIERAPTSNEPDLVVMAKPSPSFDAAALSAYSKCMRVMPPGVPLAENFTGDWFKSVLKTVGQYAPAVSRALVAVPGIGGSLSTLVGGIGQAANAGSALWGSGSANSRKPKSGGANGGHQGPVPPSNRSGWAKPKPTRPPPPPPPPSNPYQQPRLNGRKGGWVWQNNKWVWQ